jgi:hypothetical protein
MESASEGLLHTVAGVFLGLLHHQAIFCCLGVEVTCSLKPAGAHLKENRVVLAMCALELSLPRLFRRALKGATNSLVYNMTDML